MGFGTVRFAALLGWCLIVSLAADASAQSGSRRQGKSVLSSGSEFGYNQDMQRVMSSTTIRQAPSIASSSRYTRGLSDRALSVNQRRGSKPFRRRSATTTTRSLTCPNTRVVLNGDPSRITRCSHSSTRPMGSLTNYGAAEGRVHSLPSATHRCSRWPTPTGCGVESSSCSTSPTYTETPGRPTTGSSVQFTFAMARHPAAARRGEGPY